MNIRLSLIGLLIVTAVSGCASTPPIETGPQPIAAQPIFDLYRGFSVDYQRVSDPDLLVRDSTLVVHGEIIDAFWGRTWGIKGDAVADWKSITLSVKVDKVYSGDSSYFGKTIYLEQQVSSGVTPSEFKRVLVGTKTGLFLSPAASPTEPSLVQNALGGRPEGEPLWISGPQGFVIDGTNPKEVIWPILQDAEPGLLADALPGGSLVPSE